MSITVNKNHTDSAVSGVTSLSLDIPVLNHGEDFGISGASKNELILTNNTSPIDRPEVVRYSLSEIPNIYKGTNIDPNLFVNSKRGVSLLIQVSGVWSKVDSVTGIESALPYKAWKVIQVPMDAIYTADNVAEIFARLDAFQFDTGVVTSARLGRMLRGSLRPNDLS